VSNVVWNFLKAFVVIFHYRKIKGGGNEILGSRTVQVKTTVVVQRTKMSWIVFPSSGTLAGGCSLAARSWRRLERREGLVTDLCVCSPESK